MPCPGAFSATECSFSESQVVVNCEWGWEQEGYSGVSEGAGLSWRLMPEDGGTESLEPGGWILHEKAARKCAEPKERL